MLVRRTGFVTAVCLQWKSPAAVSDGYFTADDTVAHFEPFTHLKCLLMFAAWSGR